MAITRNAGATYFIPSENEWYKAAYYKGGSTNAGYWTYPTQSNTAPATCFLDRDEQRQLLRGYGTAIGYTDPTNYLTPVGAFAASPGPYGTFDMGGDVWQWNEANVGGSRGLRGGAWYYDSDLLASSGRGYYNFSRLYGWNCIGFRVASIPDGAGHASWTTSTLDPGTHSITAVYSREILVFSPARPQAVNPVVNQDTVSLNWPGAGSVLSLTENTSGATPTIIISEPSPNVSQLKIDLGAGHAFASGSTTSATGLTYQNPGSPTTSQFATIDISLANNVSALVATLPGDDLTLGPIRDLNGGIGSITASAGTIEVAGINTSNANGNVDLKATGNLTVDSGAIIETGTGTISLAADVKADGTGDDGVGTLSIGAGATVTSSNPTASAITLRGADINIDTSANPAVVGASRQLSTTPTATLTGLSIPEPWRSTPAATSTWPTTTDGSTVSKFAPGSTTPTATLTGLNWSRRPGVRRQRQPLRGQRWRQHGEQVRTGEHHAHRHPHRAEWSRALAFDSSGNLYVANYGQWTR